MPHIFSLVSPSLAKLLDALLLPHKIWHHTHKSVEQLQRILNESKITNPTVIVDLKALRRLPQLSASTIRGISQHPSAPRVILIADDAQAIFPEDGQWFTTAGAAAVLPQVSASRWNATGLPLLNAISPTLSEALNARRLAPFLRTFAESYEKGTPAAEIAIGERSGHSLMEIATAMRAPGGVEIADRTYHLRGYPECFVASTATGWLAQRYGVSREEAVSIGVALQHAGLIYHVAREQAFGDASFFFRVAKYPAQFSWPRFLERFFAATGVAIKDRTFHAKTYPSTFIGSEAAKWLSKDGFSTNEAMTIGQRMIDLSIMHHVVDEHPFRDGEFFYRAYKDEVADPSPAGVGSPAQRLAAAK